MSDRICKLYAWRDALNRAPALDRVKHDQDLGDHDERTSDQTQPRHTSRHQLGSVHQVPQDDSVGETREEAGPNQERSTIDRNERLAENRSGSRRRILAHAAIPAKNATTASRMFQPIVTYSSSRPRR
jgi:hypothetical protein